MELKLPNKSMLESIKGFLPNPEDNYIKYLRQSILLAVLNGKKTCTETYIDNEFGRQMANAVTDELDKQSEVYDYEMLSDGTTIELRVWWE